MKGIEREISILVGEIIDKREKKEFKERLQGGSWRFGETARKAPKAFLPNTDPGFDIAEKPFIKAVRKDQRLDLIIGSIEKWFRIAFQGGKDEGRSNCPLCEHYTEDECRSASSEVCPVEKHTGLLGCHSTPLTDWARHQGAEHYNYVSGQGVECPICLQIAIEEIEFLCKVYRKEAKDEFPRSGTS